MKTAEEWHHTEKYVRAMRAISPDWKCRCSSCEYVRKIQLDAFKSGLMDAAKLVELYADLRANYQPVLQKAKRMLLVTAEEKRL